VGNIIRGKIMPTELSPRQAFDKLISILNERKLTWVVDQVQEQIRVGKPMMRRVKELKPTRQASFRNTRLFDDEPLRPGRKVEFRATEAYTATEQLQLLLSAIQQAVVNTAAIEKAVSDKFPGVTFVSEQADVRITLTQDEFESRSKALARLQKSLNDLGAVLQFVFRTSPGFIFSTAQPYTYAVISLPGSPLGVQMAGRSEVLHECDVAVLPRAEAETCRQNNVHPRSSKLILAVECKFYTVSLPLHLARSFIGLGVDIGVEGCHFVVNTNSDVIEKLLTHHKRRWEHKLVPGAALEVGRLRNSFQTTFKNFIAVNY